MAWTCRAERASAATRNRSPSSATLKCPATSATCPPPASQGPAYRPRHPAGTVAEHISRKPYELLEAEHKLFKQVWYNRHWNLRISIERGKHKLVTREEWEKAPPKRRHKMTIDTVWEGALATAKRTEDELGPDNIGPWTDFEWGMVNGKLSAIRWVLGDEWDMLDT